MTTNYNFLRGWEGKIIVCRMYDEWQTRRQDFLYNGVISNQNLREKLPNEIILEFDHKEKLGFEEARKEAENFINRIKEVFIKNNVFFYVTDHKGKSPHIRFFVNGLEHYPNKYAREYKLRLVEDILKEIGFKSDLIELDRTLITSITKLISLEERPHFKEKYNGEIERIIFDNKEGIKPEVKKEIMEKIIADLNNSYKIDNKEISISKIEVKDVNIEKLIDFWKKHYKEPKRNALLLAFGGICVRKGLTLEEAGNLLKFLLDSVELSNFYDRIFNELKYSFEHKKEEIAVLYHLKNVFSEEESLLIHRELKECFLTNKEIEFTKVKLFQLKASYIGKSVSIDCQITGEQSQKALVIKYIYICPDCSNEITLDFANNEEVIIFSAKQEPKICSCGKKGKFNLINREYSDHSILYVRDLLDKEEKFLQQRYEQKQIYVIGKELPRTKIISIKGKVIIEPKTNNISIIANDIKPLKNQIEDFTITSELKQEWKKYFSNGINLAEEINPDIVGEKRKIAKKSVISQLHSPCQIYDIERKKIIRGGLNVLFFGDTKVAKSEIAKDVTNKGYYALGEYSVCETGGRTGFLYTIDSDKGALIWGSLPLNDMGLLVLDGLQSMHSDEIGEFREALEIQEVIVNRSIKGTALARTRILGCMNPNKPMNEYIYKCQALKDNYVFFKTPELTRWDLFIPFCQKDVSSDIVQKRTSKDRQIPKEIFISHIFWIWSRKPEQMIYTESSVGRIKEISKELIDNYSLENLPIVHNGVRDILTRLSVSIAGELHSTDESHENIIVEKEHVNMAYNFYTDVLNLLQLDRYKEDIEGKSSLTDNDCISIAKELGKTEWNILELIKHEPKSSTQLSEILNMVDKTIKRHYDKLKRHELIETKTGKGISLSLRGIKFVRWGMQTNRDIGTKSVPNKNNGDKKSPYVPMEVYTPIDKKVDLDLTINPKGQSEFSRELPEREVTPKDKVLAFIRSNPDCSHSDVYNAVGLAEEEGDRIIQALKNERLIFEPKPDKLRVLE